MELPWDPVHSAATAGMPPVATYPSPPPPLQPLHSTPPTAFYNTHPHPGFSIPPLPGAPAPAPVPLASPVVDKPRRGRRRRLNAEPSYDTEMGHEDLAATHPASPLSAAASASSRKGVVIKTKFPVARIKRIMQADEDVGKVAQVTPVVVSKALELFMVALCDKATAQARQRNSKRITAAHLKQAVLNEEQFDFLEGIIEKAPDIMGPQESSAHSNGGGDSDEHEAQQPPAKKPRKPRQKKIKDDDAF